MGITFALLAGAVVALWRERREARASWLGPLWLWLWLASLGAALVTGVVQPWGAVSIGAWVGAVDLWAALAKKERRDGVRWLTGGAVLGLAGALMLHRLPGFANVRVLEAVRFTPDAVPFSLYLNYDKTLIGLFLLGWTHERMASAQEWRTGLAATWPRAAATMAAVLAVSLAIGYIRWAPKLPAETGLWLGVNLLFTCTAEEALFRGFIQGGLRRAWAGRRGGVWWALAVAAAAFGLAHAAGGWAYVGLATLAGAGYGWVYERTQRVEASIVAHFALNAVHFGLFTYPALAG